MLRILFIALFGFAFANANAQTSYQIVEDGSATEVLDKNGYIENHTIYFLVAPKKKLKENNLITKEGSWLFRIFRKWNHNPSNYIFDTKLYQKGGKYSTREISTNYSDIKAIYPSRDPSSYRIANGNVLEIIDQDLFWIQYNYLIIRAD